MTSFRDEIHPFRARRSQTREAFAGITGAQITARVEGGGDVRSCLWRIATAMNQRRVELARTFTALGWRQTEAQQILALTMESRGELRSLLLGVPDEYIDMEPAPDEWSVRQALEHAYAVDQRYMQATEYAVERMHSDSELPIQRPRDGRESTEDERLEGRLAAVMTKLHLRRDDVISHLAGLSDEDLKAPIVYQRREVDVRYRLYLLSAHEREHTGQVARTLRAVGFAQSEAQMILGQTETARGVIEGMLIGIPDEHLTRTAPGGLPSVHDILAQAVSEEDAIAASISGAIGAGS